MMTLSNSRNHLAHAGLQHGDLLGWASRHLRPILRSRPEIDGANAWQRFRFITLPLLSPTTFFLLVTATIGAFQAFNQIYIMTDGGPANATRVILLHIYILAFRLIKIGEASAVSWALFLILFGLTLVNFVVARKWVHYG